MLLASELIKKKRNGTSLSEEEILFFIEKFTSGEIPDYQMSAFLMATYFRGMTAEETNALVKAMLYSGTVVDFKDIKTFKVDKHSTGGVGDKTSMILGPIVAACGLSVPMISGRGLGHTGGTLDKLESIPGFDTQFPLEKYKKTIKEKGICYIGQTKDICPADKKMYALRDVTATIESLPLICASIMSKKLAEGIDGLVLDVKYGNGAFMKSTSDAEALATALIQIGRAYNKKISALITNMNQPLGRFAGNSLEIFECLEILDGKTYLNSEGVDLYEDTKVLSIALSAQMLFLSGQFGDLAACEKKCYEVLNSKAALQKFKELCNIHGGRLESLPNPKHKVVILSEKKGFVKSFQTEKIGLVGIMIKAGRQKVTDVIIPTSGIEFHVKVGSKVNENDPIFTLHGDDLDLLNSAASDLKSCFELSEKNANKEELIWKILN